MYLRTRDQELFSANGTKRHFTISSGGVVTPVTLENGSYKSLDRHMEDVVGNHDAVNAAISSKDWREGGIVNGSTVRGAGTKYCLEYINWPCTLFQTLILSHLPVTGVPSDMEVAVEAASRTNPSNPSVNLPVSIFELKDIPRMLQRKAKKQKGNSVLEGTFGYEPIIRDFQHALLAVNSIESRIATLRMLGKGKLSRTRTIFSGFNSSLNTSGVLVDYHARGSIYADRIVHNTRVSKQGTVSWRPSYNISQLTEKELWKQAVRLIYGLDPQALWSDVYQVLPWSWLIDYFSNLGDLMSLTNNSVASLGAPVAVSTVTESTWTASNYRFTSLPEPTVQTFRMTRRDWTRSPVNPIGLVFRVPILTHGQMSILANLINSIGPH
jgi:hypothetical protein